MRTVTVTSENSIIKRKGKRIIINTDNKETSCFPVNEIANITFVGNAQITSPAINLLCGEGIIISLISKRGVLKGQIIPPIIKNLDLRYTQYKLLNNPEYVLKLAKEFVKTKAYSIIDFYKLKRKAKPELVQRTFILEMNEKIKKIETANSYESLLGFEGSFTQTHFQLYDKLFTSELKFEKRSRRPPRNEVNALLSFGYVLLSSIISALCISNGLDIYCGALHKHSYNRQSLCLDVLEAFRVTLVDNFVLTLINKSIFTKEDFTSMNGEFRLREESLKRFLRYWNEWIFDTVDRKNHFKMINNLIICLCLSFRKSAIPNLKECLNADSNV